jgi:hypothetical protein
MMLLVDIASTLPATYAVVGVVVRVVVQSSAVAVVSKS